MGIQDSSGRALVTCLFLGCLNVHVLGCTCVLVHASRSVYMGGLEDYFGEFHRHCPTFVLLCFVLR